MSGRDQVAGATPLDGRRLVVRSDASRAGGTGHLMRTLALAQAWRDRGGRARWLLVAAPEHLAARIAAEGIEIVRLAAHVGGPDDSAALADELNADTQAVAVVDGLSFDDAYLAALGTAGGRVLLVDDSAALATYPVGLVLNQNAHADRSLYPSEARCRFLLGTRYVLLRREFAASGEARVVPGRARRLLVTFGGADPFGMSTLVVASLASLPAALRRDAEVRVVVGAANKDAGWLEAQANDLSGTVAVRLERSVTDMPALLSWADLAITSGGSTVWELARLGTPALVIETVPVESLLVRGLLRIGLYETLGRAEDLDAASITAAASARITDPAWRGAMAELGPRVVDGKGAGRVIDALSSEGW